MRADGDVIDAVAVLELFARLWPVAVDGDDGLARNLAFLGVDVAPATVIRAGYGAGIVTGTVATVIVCFAGSPGLSLLFGIATGTATGRAVHRLPPGLAALRRSRSLGSTTGVVGRIVLRLRLEPSLERAAAFAARSGESPLARSLGARVRAAAGGPRSGLAAFGTEWADQFPPLERACVLLENAAVAPAARRDRILERALEAVTSGTRDRLAAFASTVRGPVTGLYAFGVLLPLALVGVLPAAGAIGARISAGLVGVVYLGILPIGVLATSAWLLVRRPVAFPPPRVDRSHPDVPGTPRRAVVAGIGCGVAGWIGAGLVLPGWTPPIAGAGFGIGVGLFVASRPVKAVRDRAREIESGLPDAVALVGRRVADGEAVEPAIAAAGERIPGATGEVFAAAARRQHTLRMGVREAFLGRDGTLTDVPSPRARTAASFLAFAATAGRPAGDLLVDLGDQLSTLRAIEAEGRRELERVTKTLANTASVFGPLIAGATVALADRLAPAGSHEPTTAVTAGAATDAGSVGTSALGTPELGAILGVYVLFLAASLTALSTILARGVDRSLICYRIGIALPCATATFLAAFVAGDLLV